MTNFIITNNLINAKKLTLSAVIALSVLTTGCSTGNSSSSSSADDIAIDNAVDNNQDYQTTSSGLKYKSLRASTDSNAKSPVATDNVTVHYEGTLINGSVFDSSYKRGEPTSFPLNGVIKGWTEGLQLMKEGDKFEFYIPADLAYGNRSTGSIPANSPLIFTVELLSVNR